MLLPAWLQAVVLGIVQGATEFIPVSSSGHLVLFPYLLGWERPGLAFDVALHVGTLGAIVVYFRSELWAMIRGLAGGLLRRDVGPEGALYRRLALLIVLGSVPVAVVGLLAEEQIAALFESPVAASTFLLLTGVLLVGTERVRDRRVRTGDRTVAVADDGRRVWSGDWVGGDRPPDAGDEVGAVTLPVGEDPDDPSGRTLEATGVRQALGVGLLQVLALCPGVSRSGATIAGGVFTGMTREAATRFSFLLALPALAGAALLSVPDLADPEVYTWPEIAGGVLAAFLSGYLAIRYLVALVARDRLTGFARYVVAVAVVGYLGYLMIGPPSSV